MDNLTTPETPQVARRKAKLRRAGCWSNIFLATDKNDMRRICEEEKKCVASGSDEGLRIANSWLEFWPEICMGKFGFSRISFLRSFHWTPTTPDLLFKTFTVIFNDAASKFPDGQDKLRNVFSYLVTNGWDNLDHSDRGNNVPWWESRLRDMADNLKKQMSLKTADLDRIKELEGAIPLVRACFYPPAASDTADSRDGWTVSNLSVIKWGQSLKYPVKGVMETFTITAKTCWNDIELLMRGEGNYVEVSETFLQRFNKGEALRFRNAATEAERKDKKGRGRYRLKK